MTNTKRSITAAVAGAFWILAAAALISQTQTPTPSQAQAQSPAPARDVRASDVAPSGTASLAGVVLDHERLPIRRVSVSITGPAPFARTVVTDDAGRFAFDALPAGRYTLIAKKPGYPQMSYGARQPFRTGSGVVLAEGQQMSGLSLSLARGAALEGTVFDESGQPLPGVPVMPWEVRTSLAGERVFSSPRTGGEATYSDDRGRFRLYGLPPGEYTVGTSWFFHPSGLRVPTDDEIRAAFAATSGKAVANAPGTSNAAPATPPQSFAHSPVYHPDTIDPMAARTFALTAGEEQTGVDLRMQFRPMSRIEATLVDFDGTVPSAAEVSLMRRGRIEATNSTTISFITNGQYRSATLGQGDYGLVAFVAASGDKPARSATAPVTITGPEPVKLTLTLQPTPDVKATIAFAGNTLPPPNPTTVRVNLSPVPGSFGNFNSVRSLTDAAGVATITGVTPGRYRVTATVPNQPTTGDHAWTLRSVVADGRDVTDLPLEIAAGAPPAITVTFTDQIAELSGRLIQSSGQPGTDFFVVVLPTDRQYWLPGSRRITSARPDVNGRYVFRGLPPGNYRIAVTTELDTQDLADVSVLERLVGASEPVSIAIGEKKTFDVQLGSGGA